jgi:hypothetical protein
MRACVLVAVLACLAGPAAAQTYKWVDANGVVTYSNRPPQDAKRYAQSIPERISVYEADRELERAAARLAFREQLAEQEWLQRQRLMALSAAYTQDLGYYGDYYPYHTALVARPVGMVRSVRIRRRF